MLNKINLKDILKIQKLYMRIHEKVDVNDCGGINMLYKSINTTLCKITDDVDKQKEIFVAIKDEVWNIEDSEYEPIFERLRKLGYEVTEGGKDR